MDSLRKVRFILGMPNASIGDYESEPDEEKYTKEREGYFHCFGNCPFWDSDSNHYRDRIMGIVEEGSGNVYEVFPENIEFVQENGVDWRNVVR